MSSWTPWCPAPLMAQVWVDRLHTNRGLHPSLRWVDTNKGIAEEPKVRCRWVARGFKVGKTED